jgi:uncharacterized protein (TIGR02001 family)
MNKRVSGAVALAFATLTSASVLAQEAATAPAPEETGLLAAKNFSTTIWLTTDYMFRGISNSDGPAIQGSLDWTYNGFYLGAWASNTEFSDSNFEIDYYGGYKWTWADIGFNVGGIYYTYPGEHKHLSEGFDPGSVLGPDADYFEALIGASYTFTNAPLAPSIGIQYNYSPDSFGSEGDAHAVQGSLGFTLPYEIGLYGNIGYQEIAGDEITGKAARNAGLWAPTPYHNGYDYVYFAVGLNKTLKGFKFDISYQGTDEPRVLKDAYADVVLPGGGNPRDLIEGRVVFQVSRSF